MRQFLNVLTCKRVSRYNGVPFLTSATSKNAPNMTFFVHLDLQTCFSPQRRAIFDKCNFKKRSEHDVFCQFDLQMCFSPQRRAIFDTSAKQLPPHPPL